MNLSKWIGKKVKHTRKSPLDHIISIGFLIETRTGHYEIDRDDGGKSATFDGDTIEFNGQKITIKYK